MKLYTIASGSSGNCVYVETEHTRLLVDAGVSAKRIEEGLAAIHRSGEQLDAILVTHEHIDHVRGIEVFGKKYPVPIYGTKETLHAYLRTMRSAAAAQGLTARFHFFEAGSCFFIKEIEVNSFSTSHDAGNPVGYSFCYEGQKIGIATDLGCYNDEILEKLAAAQVLYLEANYDLNMLMAGSYPYQLKLRIAGDRGHLSNDMSSQLIVKLLHEKLRHVVIAHISKENNYAELAYETIRQAVQSNWRWACVAPRITVANRDIPTEPVETEE